MCGRFTQAYSWEEVRFYLSLIGSALNLEPRFNIAPTQRAAVVRLEAEGRRLVLLRWGLIPPWSNDEKIGSRLINARAETAATTPAFRSAFKGRRCLVPISGFYEWSGPPKARQPWHIVRVDRKPYALAGLWETWRPKDQPAAEPLETFTILTTEATGLVRAIHTRMPVIVAPADFEAWLAPATPAGGLQAILASAGASGLIAYPVSPRVNSVKNDDAELIADAQATGKLLFNLRSH